MIFSMNKSLAIHSILKEKNQEKHFFFFLCKFFGRNIHLTFIFMKYSQLVKPIS